jgi:hypothetical protein
MGGRGSRSAGRSSPTVRRRCAVVEAVFTRPGSPLPRRRTSPPNDRSGVGSSRLDLIESPLRRRDTRSSDGRMPRGHGSAGNVTPARWDSISRRAGVSKASSSGAPARVLREREARLQPRGRQALQRRVEDCDTLLAFVEAFAANLGGRGRACGRNRSPSSAACSGRTWRLRRVGCLTSSPYSTPLSPRWTSAFIDVVRAEVQG